MRQYFFRNLAVDEEDDGNLLEERMTKRKKESVYRKYKRYIASTPHLVQSTSTLHMHTKKLYHYSVADIPA